MLRPGHRFHVIRRVSWPAMPPTKVADRGTERLHRDLFPVDIVLDDQVVATGARCFLTSSRALVYVEGGGMFTVEISEPPEPSKAALTTGRLEVPTNLGPMWINKGRGCGCHSPLKIMPRPVEW